MAKYTNARYPDKINDLINNDGTINLPEEGPIDNEAVAQEIKELLISLSSEDAPEALDKTFRFDLATQECIENGFTSMYSDLWLVDRLKEEKLYIIFNLTGNQWTSENSFDSGVLNCGLSIQSDAETGDTYFAINWDESFAVSGTIRFNFDPNRSNI